MPLPFSVAVLVAHQLLVELAKEVLSTAQRIAQAVDLVACRHRVDVVAQQHEVVQPAGPIGNMPGEQRFGAKA